MIVTLGIGKCNELQLYGTYSVLGSYILGRFYAASLKVHCIYNNYCWLIGSFLLLMLYDGRSDVSDLARFTLVVHFTRLENPHCVDISSTGSLLKLPLYVH